MIFVTLIEDDPVAADLLKDYLSGEELKIHNHYASAEVALERIPTLPLPDIILMDINLPGISGIEATQRLKQQFPDVDIVMMTTFEDSKSILGAIRAGASGYLLKASSSAEIRDALQEIHRGGSFLSGRIARKVLDEFRDDLLVQDAPANSHQVEQLSAREQEILDRLVKGESYKTIADACNISVHTVNNHIRKIYEKMQVHSRAEAVAKAMGVG
ncbi:MAG TPA: response regulator transcription factor [Gammaproteobacteria bacterium]|nr:response regulator transcription factor [Gammaproteobacteria bacterium]